MSFGFYETLWHMHEQHMHAQSGLQALVLLHASNAELLPWVATFAETLFMARETAKPVKLGCMHWFGVLRLCHTPCAASVAVVWPTKDLPMEAYPDP